jgi:sugar lactone lactonase YvrE
MKVRKARAVFSSALAIVVLAATAQAAGASSLYWANYTGDSIGRSNLDGVDLDYSLISSPLLDGPDHLASDSNYLYWSSYETAQIGRSNLDGSGPEFDFIDLPAPSIYAGGVAVDSNYIYWTDYQTRIGRANLDGSEIDGNFITGQAAPYGLAVDSNYIYWGNTDGFIGRANLNGTGVDPSFLDREADGVAVNANHIYWTDYDDSLVGRANLNGTGVTPDLIETPVANGPDGIALSSNHLYWANYGSGDSIGRANLDGSDAANIIISDSLIGVTGLTVREGAASISRVRVTGPAKARKGKTVSYRIQVTNSGGDTATGVRAKISGRGVSVNTSVGSVAAGATRTITAKVKFRKTGTVKAKVAVTSANAGGRTVNKTVKVVR